MLLVLDNYDSFTWNLAQYLGELGSDPMVVRNDQITVDEAVGRGPEAIVVSPDSFPSELEITAWSTDRGPGDEVMAMRHRHAPIWGVQFHPESVGTPHGKQLLANFLKQAVVAP